MTLIINTLNGGEIDTGFWGGNTYEVQLGELPNMTTQQFVGFAAMRLCSDIIPKITGVQREEWAQSAKDLHNELKGQPIHRITGKYFGASLNELAARIFSEDSAEEDRTEAWAEVAQFSPTESALFYRENPFVAENNGQQVAFKDGDTTKHVITSEDFYTLTYRVLRGGNHGWGSRGTFQEVKDAAAKINRSLNPDTDREVERPEVFEVGIADGSLSGRIEGDHVLIDNIQMVISDKTWLTAHLLMLSAAREASRLSLHTIDMTDRNVDCVRGFVKSFSRVGYKVQCYDNNPDQGGNIITGLNERILASYHGDTMRTEDMPAYMRARMRTTPEPPV